MQSILNKISNLEKLIGNTPLIEITFKYKDRPLKIYSKIEYYNYTGSIKDRVALYIIKKAYLAGKIKEKDIVAEATSGNTGISFAAICTYLNHDVHIYMPDWLSTERIKLLESFNATLHLVSKEDGGFLKCISLIEQCSKLCSDIFLPSQFTNVDNIYAHYYSTGPEIYSSLRKRHIIPSIFVAGVGTGGTVTGVGEYLKSQNPDVKVVAVEPASSPVLSKGTPGAHKIQGIGAGFVPDVLNTKVYDEVIAIENDDAFKEGKLFAVSEGILVGISSGAALKAAAILAERPENAGKNIVVILPDSGDRYLSTPLFSE